MGWGIASAAFAITGVLAISERDVDFFGVLVLGIITAIVGGTMRDVIMECQYFGPMRPSIFWLQRLLVF